MLATLLSCAAIACGARTPLEVADPLGGGGSGGQSSAPPSCTLSQLPGIALVGNTNGQSHERPALVAFDGGALLTHTIAVPAVGDVLASEPFDPWGSWPATISYTPLIGATAVTAFAIDSGPLGASALVTDTAEEPYFLPSVLNQANPSNPLAVGAVAPLFTVSNANRWLTAFGVPFDQQMYVFELTPDLEGDFKLDWGCGSTPTRAAAIAWQGDSFLVALSSGADFGGCGVPGGSGPSTRLQLARFTPGLQAELLFESNLGSEIRGVTLTGREGGAWLGTRTGGDSATIAVQRIDLEGQPIGAATEISINGLLDQSIAGFHASPVGDLLAVGFVETLDDRDQLRVQLIEPDGGLGSTAAVTITGLPDDANTTVLGKPEGGALLLGWAETAQTVRSITVARFECVSSP